MPTSSPFLAYKEFIEDGDLVVAFIPGEKPFALEVKLGPNNSGSYNAKQGTFPFSAMIGSRYGSFLKSHNGRSTMYLLHPTPELWTQVLPHRTQILYLPDIAFISAQLDLRPGAVVLEAGTGSGSFSHSIARTIAPHGHLHTFEYHEERVSKARAEFQRHGLCPELITIRHRDVCKEGAFDDVEGVADAVFLDLPSPWEAVVHAKKAFKQHRVGRVCCFSPCIEQVQKTVAALNANGYDEIKMFEVLECPQDVNRHYMPNIEQLITAPALSASAAKKRKLAEGKAADEQSNGAENTDLRVEQPGFDASVSKSRLEIRTHTSFLVFANFVPVTAATSNSTNETA
ncbi:tRNA methyltransferase complex GCD14 subunit [Ramicandelaber brevisporus]|nr:tRNA methyltransferase complex GCD14 subunit [Ramicandelaber brevisporus]